MLLLVLKKHDKDKVSTPKLITEENNPVDKENNI